MKVLNYVHQYICTKSIKASPLTDHDYLFSPFNAVGSFKDKKIHQGPYGCFENLIFILIFNLSIILYFCEVWCDIWPIYCAHPRTSYSSFEEWKLQRPFHGKILENGAGMHTYSDGWVTFLWDKHSLWEAGACSEIVIIHFDGLLCSFHSRKMIGKYWYGTKENKRQRESFQVRAGQLWFIPSRKMALFIYLAKQNGWHIFE